MITPSMFVIEKLHPKTGRWFKIWGHEESTGEWCANYLRQCQELQPKEEFRMRWIPEQKSGVSV